MSFWGALFGGQNKTLDQTIGNVGSNAGFASNTGKGDISQASNFWSQILSGNQGDISKLLAPEISGIQKRAQQTKQTASQFGDRSGGTNAGNQMIGDNAKSDVNSMISKLTGSAAEHLGSMGENLLSQGTSAYMDQARLAQKQMENWMKSILGKGVTDLSQTALNAGEGAAGL